MQKKADAKKEHPFKLGTVNKVKGCRDKCNKNAKTSLIKISFLQQFGQIRGLFFFNLSIVDIQCFRHTAK